MISSVLLFYCFYFQLYLRLRGSFHIGGDLKYLIRLNPTKIVGRFAGENNYYDEVPDPIPF